MTSAPRRRGRIEWRMVAAGGAGAARVLKPTRLLAAAEGWAMVMRRADRTPIIITEDEWAEAPKEGQ